MPRWSPFEPYFWSLVDQSGDCWRWKGAFDGKGYGKVNRGSKSCRAHRIAYELVKGQIPAGMLACHHCDNKWCVNPDHIFIGTHKDNMQDWTKKGFNRLANDRSLWCNGKHWATNDAAKAKLANLRKSELATGKRQVIRNERGQLMGHKVMA